MSKYFRWQGIVGFIAVVAIIVALLIILAPAIVKMSIKQGTQWYLGAEVNIEDVDISYSPLTLSVIGFQATDPEKPTHNLIAFSKAEAGVDVWQYLFGKVLIEDLMVNGFTLESERDKPGEIFRDAKTSAVAATGQSIKKQLPAIEQQLPDVKDILNDSNLLTVKASELLEQNFKQQKQKLKQLEQDLPSKARLKDYEAKVKKLTKTKIKSVSDVTKLQAALDELKSQFKQDKKTIKLAKNQLKESKKILAKSLSDVKQAPTKDWQQLKTKYQLDKVDTADFAHILFGENAREYYQTAESIYIKVKPFLDSQKDAKQAQQEEQRAALSHGRFVHFKDENPLPPWLVKNMSFELVTAQGNFQFNINELTNEHWHRNLPTIVNVSTSSLLKGGDGKLLAEVFNKSDSYQVNGEWSTCS